MPYTTLVPVEALADRLHDSGWVVLDCRHDLADPGAGRRAYLQAHIPGARFLDLDADLSGVKTGRNGRHPLPGARALADRLSALGAARTMQLVGYDASGGTYAARLWWLARWIGYERVAVLDGGWNAWLRSGQPTEATAPRISPVASFEPVVPAGAAVDCAYVAAQLGRPDVLVLDARSPDRFRGENETLDPVGGHIPGAVNRFYRDNLDTDGRFRPAQALRGAFEQKIGARAPQQVVHQCGSGVTACHNLLAMEIAGLHGSRLYPGSWSEWCADPARPVSRG